MYCLARKGMSTSRQLDNLATTHTILFSSLFLVIFLKIFLCPGGKKSYKVLIDFNIINLGGRRWE